MSLRVAEEVERYRAFVEHLRSIRSTGLRGAVSLEAMSSYTGKNGMLSRDITFFTDEAFEVFSLLYDFEVRRELMRTKAINFFANWSSCLAKTCLDSNWEWVRQHGHLNSLQTDHLHRTLMKGLEYTYNDTLRLPHMYPRWAREFSWAHATLFCFALEHATPEHCKKILRVLKDIQHPVEMPLLRALARYEQVPREAEAWRYLWIQKQHPDTVAAIRRAVAMGLVEGTEDADCDRLLELAGLKSAADLTSWELPTFDAVAQHCW